MKLDTEGKQEADPEQVERLVPLSCKTRGFCLGSGGRRMAETAARWCDELLPVVPYRHCGGRQ